MKMETKVTMKPTEVGMYVSDWSKTGTFTFSEQSGDSENVISLELGMHLMKQLQEKFTQEVEEFETKLNEKETV